MGGKADFEKLAQREVTDHFRIPKLPPFAAANIHTTSGRQELDAKLEQWRQDLEKAAARSVVTPEVTSVAVVAPVVAPAPEKGDPGDPGEPGDPGPAGPGLPPGGSLGQIAVKQSAAHYHTGWQDQKTRYDLFTVAAVATTTGAISLDLAADYWQTVGLTGAPTFATTNRAAGRTIKLRIDAGGANRALSFNAGWRWLGTSYAAGVTLLNTKIAVLTLICFGANESDVVAVYEVEP